MTNPTGPEKYVKIRDRIVIIFGIKYFLASLTIQAPANKLIARKCSQKISSKISLANIEYKPSKPLYRSKPPKSLQQTSGPNSSWTQRVQDLCILLVKT